MAPFSMQAMEHYVPKMQDIADQLIGKWDRLNPGEFVDLPAHMTNLSLDTIALCGFGYRCNSAYRVWHDTLWSDLATAFDLPGSAAESATKELRLSITIVRAAVRDLSRSAATAATALPLDVVVAAGRLRSLQHYHGGSCRLRHGPAEECSPGCARTTWRPARIAAPCSSSSATRASPSGRRRIPTLR
jgi:hypothetical protein